MNKISFYGMNEVDRVNHVIHKCLSEPLTLEMLMLQRPCNDKLDYPKRSNGEGFSNLQTKTWEVRHVKTYREDILDTGSNRFRKGKHTLRNESSISYLFMRQEPKICLG